MPGYQGIYARLRRATAGHDGWERSRKMNATFTDPRLATLDLRWVPRPPPPWFATLESRGCAIYR